MAGTDIVYQAEFTDYLGNDCKIQICNSDFTGSTTDITAGGDPCHISMLQEGDSKFQHIKATECTMELISTTSLQYLSLFLATNKTYFVRIYRDTALMWIGWINPEYYTEPFTDPPYPTKITASDGLAELKNIPLPISDYTDFKRSFISYISTCLLQTGFTSQIKVGISNFSCTTSADGAVTSRILEKLFIDYRALRDQDDMWSCMEVLEEILATLDARLYRCEDFWYIDRLDHKHEAVNYETYSSDGTYISTASVDPVIALTTSADVSTMIRFLNSPAMLEVQPAYKKFNVRHEWGNRTNILKSSSFEGCFRESDFESDTELIFWDRDKGTETALIEKVTVQDETLLLMKPIPYALTQIPSFTAMITPIETGSPASNFIYTFDEGSTNETAFINWQYGVGTFRFKFEVFANLSLYFESEPKLRSYVSMDINCSGTIYELWTIAEDPNTYEWVEVGGTGSGTSVGHISLTLPKGEWQKVDLNLKMPTQELGNAQTYIGFRIAISSPNLNAATITTDGDGIYYRNLQLYFVNGTENDILNTPTESRLETGTIPPPSFDELIETTIDENNILEPEDYEVKFAETPAPFLSDGYGLVNRYVIFDSGGFAVNLFGNGQTHTLSLVNQVLNTDLFTTYRRPLFKLRGTVMDTTLAGGVGYSFMKVLKDYNYRYYLHTGIDYDVRMCQFTGEWLQFYEDSQAGTGEFNDDFSDDFWT